MQDFLSSLGVHRLHGCPQQPALGIQRFVWCLCTQSPLYMGLGTASKVGPCLAVVGGSDE